MPCPCWNMYCKWCLVVLHLSKWEWMTEPILSFPNTLLNLTLERSQSFSMPFNAIICRLPGFLRFLCTEGWREVLPLPFNPQNSFAFLKIKHLSFSISVVAGYQGLPRMRLNSLSCLFSNVYLENLYAIHSLTSSKQLTRYCKTAINMSISLCFKTEWR